MCYELLQPYLLSRQTREFPLRYWLIWLSSSWTSSQEGAKRERRIGGELVIQLKFRHLEKIRFFQCCRSVSSFGGMFMKGKSNILTYQNNNIVRKIQARTARACLSKRLGADQLTLEGVGDFEKKFPASACRKEKIACSTNVIESLWEKREKNILPTTLLEKSSPWPEMTHPSPLQELNGRPLRLLYIMLLFPN